MFQPGQVRILGAGLKPDGRVTAGLDSDSTQKWINQEDQLFAGDMITKIFFLAKIIHRIGARNLRQEKSFLENPGRYRVSFIFRAIGGAVSHTPLDLRFRSPP
jgi:hypothetical protein